MSALHKGDSTAILLVACADQKGIVAAITTFLAAQGGNVLSLDQHVDRSQSMFYLRVEWSLDGFGIERSKIDAEFIQRIARPYGMDYRLYFSDQRPRMALFVSKLQHCFFDMLARWQSGEWQVEIPLIVSNHEDLRPIAERFGIPFHCLPVTKENKAQQEQRTFDLLAENEIDFIVLARYMQILSPEFVQRYPRRIINIHHSFLPAFPGAKPYHSAHERGVKVIGATAHYVTEELDEGPIIAQNVTPVSHRDSISDLTRKGRDLEQLVLSRAVYHHLRREVLVDGNRTIVFA